MDKTTLELALPLSLALAVVAFIAREALIVLLGAAVHEAWAKLRKSLAQRRSRPAGDGNGG
ncbi:MAG: hypothetical protein M3Q71_21130 [Chloroflexota bacterium]|nr:hypothetical protein [Chloroflexota bacterium]